ncbi:hypothetical protein Rhein_0322 [Rheinheimera sp. A13L]|uniref:hypothetical protein n=1 Tax=Rheinheimera sp. A13L TaxID=506534 RepID=UPI0002125094|nr:hypothetical protein [Rheinheimera sp. A13L]EGM79438.1 hypothetical protein Rhein_0322 [Rheinheimera sp. A13L]
MKKSNKSTLLAIAGLAASLLLAAPVAWSHGGAKPQHGGVVESKHDLSFELVREATGASLYVTDHGEAASVEGWSGQLTVLADGKKTETAFKADGSSRLVASDIKIPDGAKVALSLKDKSQQPMAVRFSF